MAIFTNKHDRENVHILVQLAQVNIQDGHEVEYIVRLILKDNFNASMYSEYAGQVIEACPIVYRTLYSIATKWSIPADCLTWIRRNNPVRVQLWGTSGSTYPDVDSGFNEDKLISINDLKPETWTKDPDKFIKQDVAELLNSNIEIAILNLGVLDDNGGVALCAECNYPMLKASKKQLFCSSRCTARAGQRKRRMEKKDVTF